VANLADDIEKFLKHLMRNVSLIEMQRATLASQFSCAPSQINYVLTTRFTPERGYVVESRRGGGGYIRIARLNLSREDGLHEMIHQQIGSHVSRDEATGYIQRLLDAEVIDQRMATVMLAAMQQETITIGLPIRDQARASLLRAMILAALRFD
jgi:transcriptional regulator of stress and heat shock response